MNTYAVIDKATGAEVYRYQADEPEEWGGLEFATHDHVLAPVEVSPPTDGVAPRRRLTRLGFIGLMTQEEFAELLTAAKSNVEVEGFIKLLDWTTPDPDGTSVDLDDPRTIAGVRALFSPERAAQILGSA